MNRIGKIAIFVDGVNLFAAVKSLGFEIDYKRLLQEFRSRGALLRAFYYTAVFEDGEHPSLQPLMDWLAYNGFTGHVVTKPGKEFVDHKGRRKVRGNINVELAIDAMEIAPHIDQMVLFSGDGRSHPSGRGHAAARRAGYCNLLDANGGSRPRVARQMNSSIFLT